MGHVIKGHGHVVPAAVMEARARADEIVAAARRRADGLRAEVDAERERARREGRAEGRAEAAAQAAHTLAAARVEADALLARAQPAAIAIAARMAEKIVGRAVALDPGVVAEIAAQALAACRTRAGAVALRVHPEALAAVEARRAELAEGMGREATLELVADEAVGRYGCVVDTTVGRVDARLETQLAALVGALTGGGADG